MNKKHQCHLYNIIALNCGTIIHIDQSMSKKYPSSYVIIPTHKGYILSLQLVHVLPSLPMLIYPTEEWKLLSHVVFTLNMDWNPSILKLTEAKYSTYDEWVDNFGF